MRIKRPFTLILPVAYAALAAWTVAAGASYQSAFGEQISIAILWLSFPLGLLALFIHDMYFAIVAFILLGTLQHMLIGLAIDTFRMRRAAPRLQWKHNRVACRQCGYSLTGNVSGICPKCGTRVPRTRTIDDTTKLSYLRIDCPLTTRNDDTPLTIYSELDEERFEHRRVEVFRKGRIGLADKDRSTGTTALAQSAVPTLDEISTEPQFSAAEIAKEEFDRVWQDGLGQFQ